MFGSEHIAKVAKELEKFHTLPKDTADLTVAVNNLNKLVAELIAELRTTRLKDVTDAARGIEKPARAKNPVGGRSKKSSK